MNEDQKSALKKQIIAQNELLAQGRQKRARIKKELLDLALLEIQPNDKVRIDYNTPDHMEKPLQSDEAFVGLVFIDDEGDIGYRFQKMKADGTISAVRLHPRIHYYSVTKI